MAKRLFFSPKPFYLIKHSSGSPPAPHPPECNFSSPRGFPLHPGMRKEKAAWLSRRIHKVSSESSEAFMPMCVVVCKILETQTLC